MHNHWEKLNSQRQSQEQHRQQEARRVEKERGLQASLLGEDSVDRKRYWRQAQQEERERQIERDLLKVGVSEKMHIHF